uniref:Uncharacterized protein n=1 Tax=viral metagenome TaxID=1070528 RepID=A0A6C0BXH0_9ZZZZ
MNQYNTLHTMNYEEDIDEETNIDINLDTNWIEEFETTDQNYIPFYNKDVNEIKVTSLYVDKENNIETIKEEILLLKQENMVTKEELIHMIKKNSFKDKKRYTILSLLKYNVDLETTHVKHYLKYPASHRDFLQVVKNIDNIPLKKTISMFQDLNTLFILFYEKTNPTNGSNHQTTKKIYISNNKTKKKQLKVL